MKKLLKGVCVAIMLMAGQANAQTVDTMRWANSDFESWSDSSAYSVVFVGNLYNAYTQPTDWKVMNFYLNKSVSFITINTYVPIHKFAQETTNPAEGTKTAIMESFKVGDVIVSSTALSYGASTLSNYGITTDMVCGTLITNTTQIGKTFLFKNGLLGCSTDSTMAEFLDTLGKGSNLSSNLPGGLLLNGFKATRLHGTYKYSGSETDHPIMLMIGTKTSGSTTRIVGAGYKVDLPATEEYAEFDVKYEKYEEEDADRMIIIVSSSNFAECTQHVKLWLDDLYLLSDPCEAVSGVTVAEATASSVSLTWETTGTEAEAWDVVVSGTAIDPESEGTPQEVTALPYTVNGLDENTSYYVYVRKKCGAYNYGEYSSGTVVTTATGVAPCEAVSGVAVSNVTVSGGLVSWTAAAGQNSWQVRVVKNGTDENSVTPMAVSTTSYTMNGLESGTGYEVKVRAKCEEENYSEWSSGSSFTTLVPTCDEVENVIVTNVTSSAANVSWTHEGGVLRYEVVWGESGVNPNTSAASTTNGTQMTLTGLESGTTYEVYVRAVCEEGLNSEWVMGSSFTTAEEVCEAVTNVTVTNIAENSATVSWTHQGGAIRYEVVCGENVTNPSSVTPQTTINTQMTLSGLEEGTIYKVYVRAVCDEDRKSEWSAVQTFTTATAVCNGVQNLAVSEVTESTAKVSWSHPDGAMAFEVVCGQAGINPNGETPQTTSNMQMTLGGLTAGTTYIVYVRAKCGEDNYSEWSQGMPFATTVAECPEVENVIVTVNGNDADISWNGGEGQMGWEVAYGAEGTMPSEMATRNVTEQHYRAEALPAGRYDVYVRTNCGGGDYSEWSEKIGFEIAESTGIESIESETAYKCFPNPTRGEFGVEFAGEETVSIVVRDMIGRQVKRVENYRSGEKIEIGNAGQYVVEIRSESGKRSMVRITVIE